MTLFNNAYLFWAVVSCRKDSLLMGKENGMSNGRRLRNIFSFQDLLDENKKAQQDAGRKSLFLGETSTN